MVIVLCVGGIAGNYLLRATIENQQLMDQNIQISVQSNVEKFKKVYNEILKECIERRKFSGFTQKDLANHFSVDVRKIIDLEKEKGGVGLLLRYADLYDIEVSLSFKAH